MRMRIPNLLTPDAGLVTAALTLGVAYPFVLENALARFGTRPVALALAALGVVVMGVQNLFTGLPRALVTAGQLAGVALALAAAAADGRAPLLFVPALIQIVLAGLFLASLRDPVCVVHRVARVMQPLVPEWIEPYCRKVTVALSALFAVHALVIVVLALTAPLVWWQLYTGVILFVATGALLLAEFVVRKSWFRYYSGTWLDRLWSAVLPAENTEQGRRSMEYIRRMRRGT